ncbi:MAG: UDP-3-O-(3-hydroxymyristoyl)glucosamine N-acyltransferase, partial [Inquilinus sp.]|nr:UDP-3-O-(3-hydroxymyristoyl)glucosamine N-acyltransferase [Inquilinus sp.]
PYKAFAHIARAFYPRPAAVAGIAAGAVVDPAARVDPTAEIGAGAVVGARAEIGARCRIGPNAVIGAGVVVGEDSEIGPNASLSHCLIGCRVRIYPGVRIGQEGFGFAMDPGGHVTVPQLGRVLVEDDVEVGANSTVDRGAGPDTVIGRGTMIDNLVQIGHNVQIGPGSVLAAQAGIAGSTRLGKFVVLAGQAGVAGHLSLGDGARVGAQAGVIRDLPGGTDVWGTPALPSRQFWRRYAKLTRLIGMKGE